MPTPTIVPPISVMITDRTIAQTTTTAVYATALSSGLFIRRGIPRYRRYRP
jgi:hypothetical protein